MLEPSTFFFFVSRRKKKKSSLEKNEIWLISQNSFDPCIDVFVSRGQSVYDITPTFLSSSEGLGGIQIKLSQLGIFFSTIQFKMSWWQEKIYTHTHTYTHICTYIKHTHIHTYVYLYSCWIILYSSITNVFKY